MTIFPSVILNSVDLNDAGIPSHWKLIDVHVGDVKDIISSELKGLSRFFSDEAIHPILRHMRKACDDLIMLMEHTPFFG